MVPSSWLHLSAFPLEGAVTWRKKTSNSTENTVMVKPGFHYPSWRPELMARVERWPVSITRQYGPCWQACVSTSRVDGLSTRLVEMRARQHHPCWQVMETGHPSTRAVNSGSGNRALVELHTAYQHLFQRTLLTLPFTVTLIRVLYQLLHNPHKHKHTSHTVSFSLTGFRSSLFWSRVRRWVVLLATFLTEIMQLVC